MSSKKRLVKEKKTAEYSPSSIKKERREAPRSKPPKNKTESEFASGGNKYADRILEVSRNGCRITTEAPLRVGDVIKFQSPVARRGCVVWSQGGVFGIEFID